MSAVRDWLEGLGLGQYADAFEANAVDLDLVGDLTDDALKELGVAAVGHRLRLRKAAALRDAAARAREVAVPAAERRQITVMFCDLVGSTALSETLDPEDLRALMQAYQQAAGAVVERFDGHVAQYLGDGLMTYFGWPRAHEDDAERAVRAGLDIVAAVKEVHAPAPLRVRVGIATGPVVVGETGAGDASVPKLAVGETPNLAARVQGLAGADEIVVAGSSRRLIGGAFDLDDRGEHALKGIVEPVHAWRVAGIAETEGRFEAAHGAHLTPLVGREAEIATLLERWTQAKDDDGQVVLLCGEPGIGKSRITQALRARIAAEPHTWLRYQCSPYHTNSALHPIIEQFERAAGFARDDPDAAKLDKMEALLSRGTGDVAGVAPLFAAMLSLDAGDRYPPLNVSPQKQKELTLAALADQVVGLAAAQPVLMIFEDAHWIDPTTQEAFDLIVPRIAGHRVLLVVAYRPEYEPHWTGLGHAAPLNLTRLGQAQAAAMVANVTGGVPLPEGVLDQIVAKTDGVPLFVEELTKTVIESGIVTRVDGRYEATGPMSDIAIPSTLQDSLMARLDRMAPVREVAQIGACIGREFSYELLAAISPLRDDKLQDALGQLVSSELVFRTGSPSAATYSFKHALVQDAAYGSLLKSRRQQLHASIGHVLVERFPDLIDSEPELIAQHYTSANLSDRAVPYWLNAGQKALSRSELPEAVAHLKNGLGVVASLPPTVERDRLELELRSALVTATFAMLGWASDEVLDAIRPALELARRTADNVRLFTFLNYQARFHGNRCEFREATPLVEELVQLANAMKSVDLQLIANSFAGPYFTWLGEYENADAYNQAVLRLYRRESHQHLVNTFNHDPKCFALSWGGMSLWMRGYPDQARNVATEQIRLARQLKHHFNLIWSLTGGAAPFMHSGDTHEFCEFCEEARAIAREQSMWFLDQCLSSFWNGLGLIVARRYAEGYEEIRQGNQLWRDSGGAILTPLAHSMMALALGHLRQWRNALALIDDSIAFIDRTGHVMHEPEVHRIKGEVLLLGEPQDPGGAEGSFLKGIAVARAQRAKSWELRAATSLARLWQSRGQGQKARDLLLPIYDWFTEGFDTKDLKDAKALLDELSSSAA